MKRVLVTGASGFIGRQTLEPLQRRGFEVHAIGRRAGTASGVIWHRGDLFDAHVVTTLFKSIRPTHLLHMAWYAEHGSFWTAPENFQWVGATLTVLQAFALHGGQRVVAAGTCAEYDSRYGVCDEQLTPCLPSSEYGACKQAASSLMHAYARHAGFSAAWGRIFHVYGPYEHRDRLVASVTTALLNDRDALCSHGGQLRDFLHVADVGDAFAALLDSDVVGAVNIGSGEAVRIAELSLRLAMLAGRPERLRLGARTAAPSDPPILLPTVQRLATEVGWRPHRDLDSGLRDTLEWWRSTLAASVKETQ
jgi:nucleoside-diphosphate-sugar epimerase